MIASTREVAEAYVDRMTLGDQLGLRDLFAEHDECDSPAATAGPWHASRSLAADFLRLRLPGHHLGRSGFESERILVDGESAVVVGRFTHAVLPGDRTLSTPVAMWLTVSDGRIRSIHLYEDTSSLVARINGKRLLPSVTPLPAAVLTPA
ncbi:nuclear transport factor 2 family protein [Catellatospora tritici]|uniref:nuclear transport factor 2 family protein n=1 Tax=Catellatospora tritici TaxID=2851566 RepID=UPI001C2D8B66|nr:nuclear transport factor 2 family protein [Catellatospora tritici]MBV1850100.1 nuclear transport factor 2 family protein [Catellatospora tritici]